MQVALELLPRYQQAVLNCYFKVTHLHVIQTHIETNIGNLSLWILWGVRKMQCAGSKWLFAKPCGGHAFTVRMKTTVSSGNANGQPSLASIQNPHLGSLMIRDAHWAHSSFPMLSIVLWVIILCRNSVRPSLTYHKREWILSCLSPISSRASTTFTRKGHESLKSSMLFSSQQISVTSYLR